MALSYKTLYAKLKACEDTYELNFIEKRLIRQALLTCIPKKVVNGCCRACGETLHYDLGRTRYCPYCGQKLDWS